MHKILVGILLTSMLFVAGQCFAAPVFWSANGHYYDAVSQVNVDWTVARDAAAASTLNVGGTIYQGYLATITSSAENAFVWGLGGANGLPLYLLGGRQSPGSAEPGGGWQWITGEAWGYTNWNTAEPDQWIYWRSSTSSSTQLQEDYLNFAGSQATGTWNDTINLGYAYVNQPGTANDHWETAHNGYVIEYAALPVSTPEPATMPLLGFGLLGLSGLKKRKV